MMSTHNMFSRKTRKTFISLHIPVLSGTLNTKTRLYSFDPLKPDFYTVKLWFTGVYINFHISAQNIDCGYSLEPARYSGSNKYQQFIFLSRNMKTTRKLPEFFIRKFSFFGGKIYIHITKTRL